MNYQIWLGGNGKWETSAFKKKVNFQVCWGGKWACLALKKKLDLLFVGRIDHVHLYGKVNLRICFHGNGTYSASRESEFADLCVGTRDTSALRKREFPNLLD